MNDYPSVEMFLHRPLMTDPPFCTLHELKTIYTLEDLYLFNDLIDLKNDMISEANKK